MSVRTVGLRIAAPPAPNCDPIVIEVWQREDDPKAPVIVEIRRSGPGGKSMRFTTEEARSIAGSLELLLNRWDEEKPAEAG